MSKISKSVCRLCRRSGDKLFLKGERCFTDKCAFSRRAYPPGQHGQNRRKPSPYCEQLREKQKVRWSYGLTERQFRRFFEMAERMKGVTGENLLRLLETRLDNIVYRAGFARSRNEARQMVSHGYFRVNGRKVDIPSYIVRVGDVISIKQQASARKKIEGALEIANSRQQAKWLEVDQQGLRITVASLPNREDISQNFKENSIVELYSK